GIALDNAAYDDDLKCCRSTAASRGGGIGGRAGSGGGRTRDRSGNQGDGRIDSQGGQVGDQGRDQGNGRNQNGDAVNDNIRGDVIRVVPIRIS
ncbi:hypothetical protein Tco_0940629, partial [Tanacetum coccineum]